MFCRRNTLLVLAALAFTPALSAHAGPTLPPTGLRKATPAAPLSKNVHNVTVGSIDGTAVHATDSDGTALDADIKPSSLFLVNGVPVEPPDFPAGQPAVLRVRTRASDGAQSVVMLSDMASAAAIDSYRKKVLIGKVLAVNDKYLLVRPNTSPDATPLTLHYTAKTIFRNRGVVETVVSFPVDAPVAIITRALPSGLLMATVVSDTPPDAAQARTSLKTTSFSGTAASVQPEQGLLRILSKTKPAQTVAVTEATRIKVRKMAAALGDITAGMHVTARLTTEKDAAGHLLAASVNAYDAPASLAHKKLVVPAKLAVPTKKAP